jgi:hypothetical protein
VDCDICTGGSLHLNIELRHLLGRLLLYFLCELGPVRQDLLLERD